MSKLLLCLGLLVFCTSCLEVSMDVGDRSIGRVDRLIYGFKAEVEITRVIARHGEITVYGLVTLENSSNWVAYVNRRSGTVRFINMRHSGWIQITYQIYSKPRNSSVEE